MEVEGLIGDGKRDSSGDGEDHSSCDDPPRAGHGHVWTLSPGLLGGQGLGPGERIMRAAEATVGREERPPRLVCRRSSAPVVSG